jgi:phosphoglycolate phosphatase-like HAD superfamily hydrolase
MALDLQRVKAVLFDVDGTLSDTDDRWVNQLSKSLSPVRWLFPARDPRAFARWFLMTAETPGNLAYSLLDWLHLDDELGDLYGYLSRRGIGKKPTDYWLIPGVDAVLKTIRTKYPLGIVSARDRAGTLRFLEQFELGGLFGAIATSQTCPHTKPFADPVIWAARSLGVTPRECIMVGDTSVDIRAGKAAGAQTVGVLCGFGREKELLGSGADLILKSTSDLAALLVE